MQPYAISLPEHDPDRSEHLRIFCELNDMEYELVDGKFVVIEPNDRLERYLRKRIGKLVSSTTKKVYAGDRG